MDSLSSEGDVIESSDQPKSPKNEETGKIIEKDEEKNEKAVDEVEEILSEEVKEQRHNESLAFKAQGNECFKNAEYDKAVDFYTKGIETCPKCYKKTVSILLSNRAACHMKTDEKEKAIEDCTQALEGNQYYTKARIRRAQMYEATEKLDEALRDYNEILSYDKSCSIAGEAAMRLPKEIQERNEKMKEEMMGKLKELGNMCLKPFGLSTENFKFTQDPNTGGYSVNFQR